MSKSDCTSSGFAHKPPKPSSAPAISPRGPWANYKEAVEIRATRFGKGRLVSDLRQDDFAELRKWTAKKWSRCG